MNETPTNDTPSAARAAIPVTVITGFLGSGKTTLINRLLAHPDTQETAVIVNEFGEIGLDHLLVRQVDETIVLLNAGCLCCTVRGDIVETLRDLFLRRARSEVPLFARVAVETTGLADPAPILHTLMTDPVIGSRYRLDGIVTTVDSVHGAGQLDAHAEPVKQAAVADRLVLTKTDLAGADAVAALQTRLRELNPAAPIIAADHGDVPPGQLFDAGLFNSRDKHPDVARWLSAEAYEDGHDHHAHHRDVNRHDDRIRAFCMTCDSPISWSAFVAWIDMLLATRGAQVLRLKGVLDVEGEDRPVAVHGVQHVFHPPAALPAWPDDERGSRIVVITRDLGKDAVEATFRTFVTAAVSSAAQND